MLHVDGVEADDGGVKAYVRFCDVLTEVVWCGVFRKVLFGAVERGEERLDGFFVGFLRPGEVPSAAGACQILGRQREIENVPSES